MAIESRFHGIQGFLILMGFSFQTYWTTNEDKITNIERNKHILAVAITVCGLLGISMVASGFSNIYGYRFSYDFTPVSKHAKQNYLILSVVGLLYITSAIFGYIGICGRKILFTRIYMMICIPFGLGMLQMYFIWLVLNYILIPDFEVTEHGIQKLIVKPREIQVAGYYMNFLLLSAILQIFCGILSFLVLYRDRKNRGYVIITECEADFNLLLKILREKKRSRIKSI